MGCPAGLRHEKSDTKRGNACVRWLLVVVVLTMCMTQMSVHGRQHMHPITVAEHLRVKTPGVSATLGPDGRRPKMHVKRAKKTHLRHTPQTRQWTDLRTPSSCHGDCWNCRCMNTATSTPCRTTGASTRDRVLQLRSLHSFSTDSTIKRSQKKYHLYSYA